tara:strand:+ start:157 stop:972 length:816 start_codon:yes stop_codon:yes gene_type:complete
MSYSTFHSHETAMSEHCRWLKDGRRWICMSYIYKPSCGTLSYAASVLNTSTIEPSLRQINNHDFTTTRRFNIRPVFINVKIGLDQKNILKIIRREMCQGMGCVGVRHRIITDSKSYSQSSYSQSSDEIVSDSYEQETKYKVSPKTYDIKTVHSVKYGYIDNKKFNDSLPYTQRSIFICFKGNPETGELLYGACIHRKGVYMIDGYDEPIIDEDTHYETAIMRLEKCPVHMKITKEFRTQLKKGKHHREDIMYIIVDNIMKRVGGCLQIKCH